MGSISNKTEEGYSSEKVGLMGFSEGRQSIFLDAKTGAAEFGLAADGADSNDPYSEGRIKLVPNGVSEISKWRIGSKSLFNVKEGNISDAYLDLKQSPLDKNGYEKSVPHDKMGILMSADPSYISIKGKQLFENSGIDFNNANAVIKPGDTMELQLDPNQFSLFTVFRHTSKIDGISDYKLKTTKENNKVEIESKNVLYRDSAADEEKIIPVYAYTDKKDETKTVYFKELVFPNEECKIKLDDNSKDETDGFYYPEKNKENNKYVYKYDGSDIEIPLIYMGEEADLKKIEAVDNSNEHIIITLADGTKLSFLKEQFNFDPTFYLDNNDYFIHSYHEKNLIFLKTEEYVAKEIIVEDSLLPNPIEEKHIGKYFYDEEKNLYFINEEYNKEAISVENSPLLPESFGESENNKYYYDKENKLYLIVKEIVKEEKPIEKIFLPKTLNQEHVGKYFYDKEKNLYFIDENCNAKKIDIKDSFEKCNIGDYYYEQKRYYHYSRETKEGLKTYCLPYSACSVQYANPDAEIGKKFELYKTFSEDSALLVIPEECIFESEFKFVNQVLIEENSEGRSIGKPAWRREPKVGIDANGRFYTNSLKDNSTALTIGNLGAFGESAADKRYIGAAFEIESNDGNSSNLLKIFTDKETAESSNSLESTPIYISASGNVDNEYTKPISFYGERISLNAVPGVNIKDKKGKNGAQSKLELGIIEEGKKTTSSFARIQSDKNSFLELKKGLEGFSLKQQNSEENICSFLQSGSLTSISGLSSDKDILSKKLKNSNTIVNYNSLSSFTKGKITKEELGNKDKIKNVISKLETEISKSSLVLQHSYGDKKSFLRVNHNQGVDLSVTKGSQLLLKQTDSATNKLLFNSNGINLSSSTIINIQNNAKIGITSGEDGKKVGGTISIVANEVKNEGKSKNNDKKASSVKFEKGDKVANGDLVNIANGTGKASLSLRGYNGTSQAAYLLSNGGTYILPTLYTDHNSSSASIDGNGVWYVDIAPNVNIPKTGRLWTGQAYVRGYTSIGGNADIGGNLSLNKYAGYTYGGLTNGGSTITIPIISFDKNGKISFTEKSVTISTSTSNKFYYEYPKFDTLTDQSFATRDHTHSYSWTKDAGSGTTKGATGSLTIPQLLTGVSEWPTGTLEKNSYVTELNFSVN